MLVYTTSYVTLVYYTRTLSNSLESFILVALIRNVLSELQRIERVFTSNPRSNLTRCDRTKNASSIGVFDWMEPSQLLKMAFYITLGVFNRPTFVLFAYVPVLCFLFDGVLPESRKEFMNTLSHAMRKLFVLSLFTLLFLLVFIQWDSYYYKFVTCHSHSDRPREKCVDFALLVSQFFSDFRLEDIIAVTPWNFIRYNMNSTNLAEHGTHSRFTHFFVNQPLLFGPLTLFIVFDIIVFAVYKGKSPFRRTSVVSEEDTKFWVATYSVPLALLSLFPHQEARFLIPLLLPLVVLYGHLIFGKSSVRAFRISWIALNICAFIFFGFLHQRAVVPSIAYLRHKSLSQTVRYPTTVVFSNTYMPPRNLFMIRNDSRPNTFIESNFYKSLLIDKKYESRQFLKADYFKVADLQGQDLASVEKFIEERILPTVFSRKIYLVLPSTMEIELCLHESARKFSYLFVKQLPWHVSTEHLPTMEYLNEWSRRGFPCSFCKKRAPCKLHPLHIFKPLFALNIYRVVHSK